MRNLLDLCRGVNICKHCKYCKYCKHCKYCKYCKPLGSLQRCQQSSSLSPRCLRRRASFSPLRKSIEVRRQAYPCEIFFSSDFSADICQMNSNLFILTIITLVLDWPFRLIESSSFLKPLQTNNNISPFLCTNQYDQVSENLWKSKMLNPQWLKSAFQERENPLRLFLYLIQCLHTLSIPIPAFYNIYRFWNEKICTMSYVLHTIIM